MIEKSGYEKYPPRLPEQPIFYPVLNEKYAAEIAGQWNVKYNEDHRGYVTMFEIDDEYAGKFEAVIIRSCGFPRKNLMNLTGILSGKYR